MDPERVPPLPVLQSEITSPVHALDQDPSGTTQPDPFNPSHSNVPRTTARIDTRNLSPYAGNVPTESPSPENLEVSETLLSLQHINDYFAQPIQSPLRDRLPEPNSGRRETGINSGRFSNNRAPMNSGIDWIVPTEEGVSHHRNTSNLIYISKHKEVVRRHTVGERLQPTLEIAIIEKDKYSAKAKWTGLTLNAAIGMQVLLGSLTTGLSALAVTGGRSVNNFFLNGIYGLSDTMARSIIISLKTAAATTALGTLFLKKKPAISTSSVANVVLLLI